MTYWNGTTWAPEPVAALPEQRTSSLLRRVKPAALLAVLALVVATSSVLAGRSSTAPWIGLATVDGARMAAGATAQPHLGSWVTFDTVVPTNVKVPRIEVLCYQGGSFVFGMAGGVDYGFLLGGGGSTWKDLGGAADCTANLFYFGWHAGSQTYEWLASTSFSAGG
jgi:hypothetical protein